MQRRWQRWLPGLATSLSGDGEGLRVDLMAGLTVGAMLVPQAMAYAELASMPPAHGFYAALPALVIYGFVGSSRHLGVGPEPGTAVLAAAGVAALAGGDPSRFAALMAALACLVGALGVLASALRLGFVAELLSKPVLVGYITGVGLTLLSSQLGKATGVAVRGGGFFARVLSFAGQWASARWLTVGVFGLCLLALLALKRVRPRWPGALVVVAAATLASAAFDGPGWGLRTVGAVPAGLPSLGLPRVSLASYLALLPTALGVLLVGYTDNVLTARSLAARLGYRIDPGQELLALGLINLGAGLAGGFPLSSSASRTAVPASLGSRSQRVSWVAAAVVVLTLVALSRALAPMPEAALAAVIVGAALAIIDGEGFAKLWRQSRAEFALAALTTVAVMVFDVLEGVLVAFAFSLAVVVWRIAFPHDAWLAFGDAQEGWVDAEEFGLAPTHSGLLVYRFDAPLIFANAERYRQRVSEHIARLEARPGAPRLAWLVLDLEGVGAIDVTALDMLEGLTEALAHEGVAVSVARSNDRARESLARASLLRPEGPIEVFPTLSAAEHRYLDAVAAAHERAPGSG